MDGWMDGWMDMCVCCLQDILLQGEGGAQVLVDPALVDHFQSSLTKVRSVPVEVHPIALSQLRVAAPRQEAISSIESSLRLDAVASAGEDGSQWWILQLL
jgi:RNA-binding protein YlmH